MNCVSRSRAWLLLCALPLLCGSEARAWEAEIHVSICRAAMGISAAVEARIPNEHRDAFFKEVGEPDYNDRDCRYHCSAAPKDPADEAAALLAALTDPKVTMRPYQRAQMTGRYLHFVADSVTPPTLRDGRAPKLPNFFANKDFVFWRQARTLATPITAALHARAKEALWANVNLETADPAFFRYVVNTVADAALLLWPRNDAAGAKDEGPVHFLVNRIDNGTAGKGGSYKASSVTILVVDLFGDGTAWAVWDWAPSASKDGAYKPNLIEKKGVQIAELSARQEKDRVILRPVFYNNSHMCADRIILKAGAWSWTMPGKMAPYAVKEMEISAPPDVLKKRLGQRSFSDSCEGGKVVAGTLDGAKRRVYGNGGGYPKFDAVLPESDITSASDKNGNPMNFSPSVRNWSN